MNIEKQIQDLSAKRAELYEQAGEVSLTNPKQAKSLWAAADALVVAMDALQQAERLETKKPEAAFDPWDLLA